MKSEKKEKVVVVLGIAIVIVKKIERIPTDETKIERNHLRDLHQNLESTFINHLFFCYSSVLQFLFIFSSQEREVRDHVKNGDSGDHRKNSESPDARRSPSIDGKQNNFK